MIKPEPYHWQIEAAMCAPTRSGWRERIAFRLRAWADRLDARYSVAYRIRTAPEISPRAIGAALRCGAVAVGHALETECRAAAEDREFQRSAPGFLFEDLK